MTPGNFVAGTALGAGDMNLLGGYLGYAAVTANQTGITTEVDLTSLTVTLTMTASRRIRVSANTLISRTVADGTTQVLIYEDAVQKQTLSAQPNVATDNCSCNGSVILTPAAGSRTYKLRMVRGSGTGTVALIAAAAAPAFILIEDLGGV